MGCSLLPKAFNNAGNALLNGLFPIGNLNGVNLVLLGDLLDGFAPLESLKRDSGFALWSGTTAFGFDWLRFFRLFLTPTSPHCVSSASRLNSGADLSAISAVLVNSSSKQNDAPWVARPCTCRPGPARLPRSTPVPRACTWDGHQKCYSLRPSGFLIWRFFVFCSLRRKERFRGFSGKIRFGCGFFRARIPRAGIPVLLPPIPNRLSGN
jgi:hypothetical protein